MYEGLGCEFLCTDDIDEVYSSDLPKINYSDLEISDCINIKPHSVLFDHGIRDYHLQVKAHPIFDKILFSNSMGEIPFDLFGASFWLLSRYEEYLPHKSDLQNRFGYKSSLAYQYEFLHYPLVNLWLEKLRKLLEEHFPKLDFLKRKYNFISTIDIDSVYKYKYKGFVRTMAGFFSDKNFAERKQRIRIILGREKDPFDCYDFLIEAHKEIETTVIYFFLLGDYGPNDKNHSSTDLRFQSLIKQLADYSMVGIHPSYGSNNNLKQLKKEIIRLGNITHKLISKSRQHFSMLKFPQTYQNLLQAGIFADYSMGYTNCNGFRASYCYPYKWYNLDIESVSSLTIHPYCMSEVTTLSESRRLNTSKPDLARQLITEVKKYGGQCISICHNDTFSAEIKSFYLDFLKLAKATTLDTSA